MTPEQTVADRRAQFERERDIPNGSHVLKAGIVYERGSHYERRGGYVEGWRRMSVPPNAMPGKRLRPNPKLWVDIGRLGEFKKISNEDARRIAAETLAAYSERLRDADRVRRAAEPTSLDEADEALRTALAQANADYEASVERAARKRDRAVLDAHRTHGGNAGRIASERALVDALGGDQ